MDIRHLDKTGLAHFWDNLQDFTHDAIAAQPLIMTQAQLDYFEDPAGSGKYPQLIGKTVIVVDAGAGIGEPGPPGPPGADGKDGDPGPAGPRGDGGGVRKIQTVSATTGTITLDVSTANMNENGNIFKISPTANITIALNNRTPDADTLKEFEIWIVQGSTVRTITWFSGITWVDGVAPVFTASKTTVIPVRNTAASLSQAHLAYEY